ncbi:MAG TPA: hypothetical protein VFQ78_12180 [Candidatus Udaeobacter sp.]|jgi:hypothetical protein|nr:hypothetical protein [Candidatus Udaeobacter sp.]
MKFPSDVRFDEEARLFIYRPSGLLDEASVDSAVRVLEELEKSQKQPFNRFSDASRIERLELNYQYVIRVSLCRVLAYGDRPPVKSAMLATDPTIAHYFQLHAIITEESPINVRVFRERGEAANWLGVSIERLAPNFPAG